MDLKDVSLANLAMMNGGKLPVSVRWPIATTHEDRFQIIEDLLDDCYRRLTDGRKHNQSHSEDALTQAIVDMMSSAGVAAERDPEIGGHADIVVRSHQGFLFVCEAKIHRGYGWLLDGFKQLSTRYGLAQAGRDRGELVIYCRRKRPDLILTAWKKVLIRHFSEVKVIEEDIETGGLFFQTSHTCESSGCKFSIRHKIVPMRHRPEK